MLGISDGTSKWHLSSARKKLAEWLKRAMNSSKVI
jgi:DNA-directed RNA polymerase specialized sigma24 family protein